MKACITYPTYVHDLVEGVSKNVHYLREALNARGIDASDGSPRVPVEALNSKTVYFRQGIAGYRRIMQAIDDPSTDIVHYHTSIPGMSVWGALARMRSKRRIPMVLHMWNPWYNPVDVHIDAGIERFYHRVFNGSLTTTPWLSAYDTIVVSSEYQRLQLEALGITSNVRVIPNGVDLDAYAPAPTPETRENARRELGLPVDKTLLLYYGHLTPWKGVDVLVEALPRALEENPDAHVVLAHTHYGQGGQRIRNRLRELGLLERVSFLGLCEVPLLLQAVDAGVVPATAAVGTACHPNVVLEYHSAGIPIVASRVGSIPEAVVDGKTGLLAQPGDAADLGEKLHRLLADDALRGRLATSARQHAEAEFNWGRIAKNYETTFQEVLV